MKGSFVIRYAGDRSSYFRPSYFRGFAGTSGLPRFGGTLAETPRYATEKEANAVILAMPFVASVMCEAISERAALTLLRTKVHYAGVLRVPHNDGTSTHIGGGYAACCSGARARKVAREGNNSYDATEVSCKRCLALIAKAEPASDGAR